MPPDEPGPSRAEHPLVSPGDQKVAPELGEAEILNPQGMDPVYAEDDAILLASRAIDGLDDLSHFVDWQLESRAGMDPGDGHSACGWGNTFSQGIDDLAARYGFE